MDQKKTEVMACAMLSSANFAFAWVFLSQFISYLPIKQWPHPVDRNTDSPEIKAWNPTCKLQDEEICQCNCKENQIRCSIGSGSGGGSMGPVKNKGIVEQEISLDNIEMHSFEFLENGQSIDTPVYHRRRTAGLWTALASLAVVLAVGVAYGYSVLSKHNAELNRLAGRVNSFSAVRDHANRLEAMLKELSAKQESLKGQGQKVDAGLKSGLDDVRLRAAALVANVNQREHNDLNQRTAALNAEIVEMSSLQHTEQAPIAHLERELASARQELASAKASYTRRLAALRQQQISNQRDIASLKNLLSTSQIDFEAEKDRNEEIVQGISLHLTGTDLAHQRFRGWVWIAGNSRKIWVRSHSIERPVVFYPKPNGKAYELVVTQVKSKDVAGYLLVPSDTSSQQQDIASNSRSVARSAPGTF